MSDSVDIRSCVLLGNPQPFRTWNGEIVAASRDQNAVSTWLQTFTDDAQVVESGGGGGGGGGGSGVIGTDTSGTGTGRGSGGGSGSGSGSGGSGRIIGGSSTGPVLGGSRVVPEEKELHGQDPASPPLASSREFRFRTRGAKSTSFAEITSKRLRTHLRQSRRDTGFSLWMRGDVLSYVEDVNDVQTKRRSLQAQDVRVRTNRAHVPLDVPEVVLADAHHRVVTNLEEMQLPPPVKIHLQSSFLLPSVILPNDQPTKLRPKLRSMKVSTIHHISKFRPATLPPEIKHVVVPFKEMGVPVPEVPPPCLDETSTFQPICGLTSMRPPEKYRRRYALPQRLPPASSMVGHGYEEANHRGSEADEGAAVQAAIAAEARNKEYKRQKLKRAMSRGRS